MIIIPYTAGKAPASPTSSRGRRSSVYPEANKDFDSVNQPVYIENSNEVGNLWNGTINRTYVNSDNSQECIK